MARTLKRPKLQTSPKPHLILDYLKRQFNKFKTLMPKGMHPLSWRQPSRRLRFFNRSASAMTDLIAAFEPGYERDLFHAGDLPLRVSRVCTKHA
jgi:hypothetical protein